jgi:hypothetical protein
VSRNGSGTYSLYVPGNPVVTGTTISSTWANNTLNDIATALTNSIAKDGQTTPTANLPMGTFKLTGLGAGSASTDSVNMSQLQSGAVSHLTGVAGVDTITATATPAITAYAAGNKFTFVAAGANTGAVTLNVNGVGAKAVTKSGLGALSAGDIAASSVVSVIYDGTQFQLVAASSTSIQTQTSTFYTTGGTSTAYTLTPSPALASLITGHRFSVVFNATAGATPTLAISGLTAKLLKVYDSTGAKVAASATSITANLISDVIYDGTDYIVLNPAGTIVTYASNAEYVTGAEAAKALSPAVARARNIVAGTPVATTSGTSIDFTSIPSWVKRITVAIMGVSVNGTSIVQIQIGDSGGIETATYLGTGSAVTTGAGSSQNVAGFRLEEAGSASFVRNGVIQLVLADSATNTWAAFGVTSNSDSPKSNFCSGIKALSGALDRIRLTTVNGTDTFDAGSVNILYE